MNFLAIDFETASYQRDSACSVGLVKVVNGEIKEKVVHLIRPPSSDFVFTYIHGITWEQVEKALTFGEIWPTLKPLFEDIDFIGAHNASFDRGVLGACCERYGFSPPDLPWECSVKLARSTWGISPANLANVSRVLGIELNHHEALSDALACARIFLAKNEKSKGELQVLRDESQLPLDY